MPTRARDDWNDASLAPSLFLSKRVWAQPKALVIPTHSKQQGYHLRMGPDWMGEGQVHDCQVAAETSSSTMDFSLKDQMGLVEPQPPSPFFINLPPTPCEVPPPEPQQQQEHAALEYISRMLMEEEDRVLLQYHDDHPVLIQVQQSLAHVISSSSSSDHGTSNDASTTKLCSDRTPMDDEPDGTMMRSATSVVCNKNSNASGLAAAAVEHNWSNVATMSFLTGMAEASKFLLPRHSCLVNQPQVVAITTAPGADARRASKLMAMTVSEEELHLHEMISRMLLNDCEISGGEMEDLRATIRSESAARVKTRRRKQLQVDLHALLLRCAETVTDDHRGARELLEKIKHYASPTGDATQRMAHCFAEALEARLAGTASLPAHRRSLFVARRDVEFLRAYRLYMATCCFKKVAFAFSNRTICGAAAGRSRLHVVDYGIAFGFQWPGLLRMLAAREGGPPEVTITGIDLPKPGFRPASDIEETGIRLSNCARELGVPFKFRAIATAKWDTVRVEDLGIVIGDSDDEVLVVNNLFRFETLVDDSVVVDRASPRDVALANIRRMRPAVFTLGVVNGFYGSSFLTRFRDALFHYSAMFDVLDATMPRGSHQRLVLERDILAPFALNVIACEGRDRTDRFDSYKQWHLRLQRAGLRQLPLDRDVAGAVTDIVKKQHYHKDFVIDEDRQWLLQGWKGRILYAHSTWVARDD